MSKIVKRNHRGYRASGKMCQNRRTKKHLSTEQVSNRILAVIGILTLLLAFVSVRSTMGENSSSAANTEAYPAPQAETIAYANESIASDVNSQANISYTSSAANTTSSGGQITDRGFGGHRHDAELGLIYMNGRYYVPSAGRFVSPDPVVPNPANPQAWNRYSYVYNNPVTLSDPTGHIPCYMYCPQETYDPVQGQFMANYAGPWDVDQQRANAARAEAFFRGTAETAAGMLWEPADWAIAASDGLQWYDGLGMLPLIPASWGDNLGRFAARYGDEFLQSVRLVDNPTFRNLTYGNFRENLSRFTGFMPTNDFEAHHILPNKFANRFERAGFIGENSIHNPIFGTWVQKGDHQSWTRAYQDRWEKFFVDHNNPTMEQVLNFAKDLSEEYGFDIYLP